MVFVLHVQILCDFVSEASGRKPYHKDDMREVFLRYGLENAFSVRIDYQNLFHTQDKRQI